MIQQGDMVKLVGKVNFVEGYMAEVQCGDTKFWLPVDLLQRTIGDVLFGRAPEPTNPPDLGISVSDGMKLGERLS